MSPFSEDDALAIRSLGESRLLSRLREWLGPCCPESPAGMGDDCAVLPQADPRPNLVTVDALVLGRHFEEDTPPEEAGAKLVNRNLSDIAAMGGFPQVAVLALLMQGSLRIEWLERFVRSLSTVATGSRLQVVGGDLSTHSGFAATLTVLGFAPRPLTRQGGEVGDSIWVTGSLGGSLLGHHLHFQPRLREGRWLAARPEVKAMIDLTDGLAKDLPALLPAGAVAILDAGAIPVSEDARRLALHPGSLNPLTRAFSDGEDYELLFIVDQAADAKAFGEFWKTVFDLRLTRIGTIARAPASSRGHPLVLGLDGAPICPLPGYEHFR